LGLTVAERIVKVLGGELGIDSTPGQGSRFHVYLPAVSETFARARRGPGMETTRTGGNGMDRATPETSPIGRGLQ